MLFFSAVSPKALELLKEIQSIPVLNDFYLVGGTALALKFGHRISVDLDYFTSVEFDTNILIDSFKDNFSIHTLAQAKNSITLNIRSVKSDFIRHNYPLLNPIQMEEGIRMASLEDIAAMKLNAILNRGSKKDFFDIAELLKHFTLEKLISFHSGKYNFSSPFVVLKSLVYFIDAENDPDPVSNNESGWNSVKHDITEAVSAFE